MEPQLLLVAIMEPCVANHEVTEMTMTGTLLEGCTAIATIRGSLA